MAGRALHVKRDGLISARPGPPRRWHTPKPPFRSLAPSKTAVSVATGRTKPPNPLRHIRFRFINLSIAARDRQRRRIRCGVFAPSSEPHT
jgi:hypothetical protein